MRTAALLLLAGAAAAQALELPGIVRKAEGRAARRFHALAREADEEGLHAVAAELASRALELDPDLPAARRLLGYERARRGWRRGPAEEAEVAARTDADALRAEEYRRRGARLDEERIAELIRVCTRYGTLEERRPYLLPLLDTMPRRADVHEALGHERIGGSYVRPGLVPTVRLLPLRLQAWRNHAEEAVPVGESTLALALPGLEAPPVWRRAGGCDVASVPDLGRVPAEAVARTRAFLRFLLGEDAELWTPPPVVFLGPAPYEAFVRALHPDPEEFALYHRFENYERTDFYAIRVHGEKDAAERYAHGAGYLTMFGLAAGGDRHAHAWLLEGFGYLVSLELFDAGNLSYVSIEESQAKTPATRPPPPARTRAACLAWVREEMREGRAHALAEVCARSINDLDLCASLQAWTFLRFLFLHDPEGARRLPAALARQKGGQPQRVDRALREACGGGLAELAPLWRAFVLEIG